MIARGIYIRYLRHMQDVDPDKKYLERFERKWKAARTDQARQALLRDYYEEAHRVGLENTLEAAISGLTAAIRKSLPAEDEL